MDPISLNLRVGRLPAASAPTGGELSAEELDGNFTALRTAAQQLAAEKAGLFIGATAPDPAVYPIWITEAGQQYVWDGVAWFEVVVREVRHKRLIDRVLEARAERIKPLAKRARKRARVIEVQAAEIAQSGNEAQFYALMQQWLAQKPQLPEEPGIDLEQLFMAQVAMQLQRMEDARRLFEQDEEEALIALLLA